MLLQTKVNEINTLQSNLQVASTGCLGGSNRPTGSHDAARAYRVDQTPLIAIDSHANTWYAYPMGRRMQTSTTLPSGTSLPTDLNKTARLQKLREMYPAPSRERKQLESQISQKDEIEQTLERWRETAFRAFLHYDTYCREIAVSHPANRLTKKEFKIAWLLINGATPDVLIVVFKTSLTSLGRMILKITKMLNHEPKTVEYINHLITNPPMEKPTK